MTVEILKGKTVKDFYGHVAKHLYAVGITMPKGSEPPDNCDYYTPAWGTSVLTPKVEFFNGWNCSYHDCYYGKCVIVAYAETKEEAKRMLMVAVRSSRSKRKRILPSCQAEVRQMVREGD